MGKSHWSELILTGHWTTAKVNDCFGYLNNQREATLLQNVQ